MSQLGSGPSGPSIEPVASARIPVLIIGAGTSGIAAARELDALRIEYRILESSGDIGGIWGRGMHHASYPGLLQNTAPNLTVFEHPMVEYELRGTHFSREEYAEYLYNYVSCVGIINRVEFNTRATCVHPQSDGLRVDVSTGTELRLSRILASNVIYAGGLHHQAFIPDIRGISTFAGDICHSSEVSDFSVYRRKRVLLIGLGNTSADLAVSLRRESDVDVHLSRRGAVWVVPREIGSTPIDTCCQMLRLRFPQDWSERFHAACVNSGALYFGNDGGSECIDFRKSRITVNTDMIGQINTGRATVHTEITGVEGRLVCFDDQTEAEFDSIVFCTGYSYRPIFMRNSSGPLIGNVRDPKFNIWYIGAPAVWGGSPRLAQYQSSLAAHAICRKWSAAKLCEVVCRSRFTSYKRATSTVGPGLEVVDFIEYQNLINDICKDV